MTVGFTGILTDGGFCVAPRRRVTIVAVFIGSANLSVAGPAAYTCEVEHVYELADDASLKPSYFARTMKGGTFSVSRITGEIVGQVLPTLMSTSTRVVNYGSKENSFKTVAAFEGQVQVLEVQEFAEGATKPFVAMSMGGAGIVTGECK
jgi:hypothetical protein